MLAGAMVTGCTAPPDVVAFAVDGAAAVPWAGTSDTPTRETVYRVRSGGLQDPCGTRIVLRGINEMASSCPDRTGGAWLAEMARTGANAVRLWVGQPGAVISELETLLYNAERQQLLVIVTLHDPAGDWSKLQAIVSDWVNPNLLSVLRSHQSHLILDIADTLGDEQVTDDAWVAGYTNAIQAVRATGLRLPLIVGAPSWGTRASTVLDRGKDVLSADPQQNVLLSIATTQATPGNFADQDVSGLLATAAERHLPLIVSAFSPVAKDCATPVSYRSLLSGSQTHAVGWFAWSWGATPNAGCAAADMSDQGAFDHLSSWGLEVVATSEYGLQATSKRTPFQLSGTCP